jgi:hypothetical protein
MITILTTSQNPKKKPWSWLLIRWCIWGVSKENYDLIKSGFWDTCKLDFAEFHLPYLHYYCTPNACFPDFSFSLIVVLIHAEFLKHFYLRVGTIFKHCGGVLYLKFVKQLLWWFSIRGLGWIWQEVKEGKEKFWNSVYKGSEDHRFGTYCPHMAALDFFSSWCGNLGLVFK